MSKIPKKTVPEGLEAWLPEGWDKGATLDEVVFRGVKDFDGYKCAAIFSVDQSVDTDRLSTEPRSEPIWENVPLPANHTLHTEWYKDTGYFSWEVLWEVHGDVLVTHEDYKTIANGDEARDEVRALAEYYTKALT